MSLRVLVCGGRDYTDQEVVWRALDQLHERYGSITHLIEGGARGADRLGRLWARTRGVATRTFPARWRSYGKRAGHIRNRQMLDEGRPDFVIAFPGGRGTSDMVRQAQACGVTVWMPIVWELTPVSPLPMTQYGQEDSPDGP